MMITMVKTLTTEPSAFRNRFGFWDSLR